MQEAQVDPQILRWSVAVADRRDHEGLLWTLVSTILVVQDPASNLTVCILTKIWVASGGAGRERRLKLTSATRHAKHLATLDQILNSSLDLCAILSV